MTGPFGAAEIGELDPDLLYVFVFGPGVGESIVVRVPPDHWMVVDSLRRHARDGERNPALMLLEQHGAYPELVALTHPHLDHADGFAALVARRSAEGLVGCASAFASPGAASQTSSDAQLVRRVGPARTALSAVHDAWEREPESRFVLEAGAVCSVGPAQVQVMYPPATVVAPVGEGVDLNTLSSPMFVTWQRAGLLLAADLPYPQWAALDRSNALPSGLTETTVLKAAHHGSRNAQHPAVIGSPPPRTRFCVVTPFQRGKRLPSFEDGHGIAQLLDSVEEVHLTACLTPAPGPASRHARRALRDAVERARFGDALLLEYEAPQPRLEDCWAAAAVNTAGAVAEIWRGSEAVVVI